MLGHEDTPRLAAVLEEAQHRGFLGPGPVVDHIERAVDMADAVARTRPGMGRGRVLDLGSGGGVPGLALAILWPDSELVLLEGGLTRAKFLNWAVEQLELASRVSVSAYRAEVAGRGPLRGKFDLVVSRSFGLPAVTAECAAPFLKVGGWLVVAEPPGGQPDRWDVGGLDRLAMRTGPTVQSPSAFQFLEQVGPCPERFPRRTGIPSKRPLF